jgi:hypothetical protein
MHASLIPTDDEHHWVLLDHQVTALTVDPRALRLQTWSLDGSTDVRVAAPFTLAVGGAAARTLDPIETLTLAPALALLRRRLASLTVTREGELTAAFADGGTLVVPPDRRAVAWEVQGGGALEGMAYRAPTAGERLW